MKQGKPIRVMLVDDHLVVRSGLGAVLMSEEDLSLVGEAGNGEDAIRMCERLQPDVVLMDLMMPVMDGVTATKIIREKWLNINVIALTSFKEKDMVEGALKKRRNRPIKIVSGSYPSACAEVKRAGCNKLRSNAT